MGTADIKLDVASMPLSPATNGARKTVLRALNRPLVSIIVVNFNGAAVMPKCLAALAGLDYPNCELIIVDNGSTDGSIEFAEGFEGKFPQHILRFPKNQGLAIARNAGIKLAKGSYIAFVDNDGFPQADWLDAAIDAFGEDPKIGVVASLVVFDRRPDIINGLGGGMDALGIGFDFLYHRPLGFHGPPTEILYPMGCGMVISQELAAQIFPIDDKLVNYYDDVEVGIRAWIRGYIVKPCPEAKVNHAFNHSSRKGNLLNKEILCHRNRVRTALKYWPLAKLPSFLAGEVISLAYFVAEKKTGFSSIFLWNVWNLPSALAIRSQFHRSSEKNPFPTSLPKETRLYPINTDFAPKWENVREVVDMEAENHSDSLDFGWFYLESIHQVPFRYTTDIASAFLRTKTATNTFLLRFVSYTDEPFTVEIMDKATGRVLYHWELSGEVFTIHSVHEAVELPAGDYQVLFKCNFTRQTGCGRMLGVGINFIGLWSLA